MKESHRFVYARRRQEGEYPLPAFDSLLVSRSYITERLRNGEREKTSKGSLIQKEASCLLYVLEHVRRKDFGFWKERKIAPINLLPPPSPLVRHLTQTVSTHTFALLFAQHTTYTHRALRLDADADVVRSNFSHHSNNRQTGSLYQI